MAEQFVNRESVEDLENSIIAHKPVLLFGPPGTGKTTSVYAIAKKHDIQVFETNASDERRKERMTIMYYLSTNRSHFNILLLFDEIDGIEDFTTLKKVLRESIHPVVLTANEEWKVPEEVKKLCKRVRYRPIPLQYIVDEAKKHNAKDFSGITTGDMRSGVLSAVYGGVGYHPTDNFKRVEQIFVNRKMPDDWNKNDYIWLVDNIDNFYGGTDVLEVTELLSFASMYNKPELISFLPKGRGKPTYPHYLRKIKIARGEGKEQEEVEQ